MRNPFTSPSSGRSLVTANHPPREVRPTTRPSRLASRCRRRSRWRVQRQRQRREGLLCEIEFLPQIAEVLDFLSDSGARVGSSVRRRIKALPTQEHVFYELQIGVERERLVIDRPCTYPRRDHDAGNTESITVDVEVGRVHVIV